MSATTLLKLYIEGETATEAEVLAGADGKLVTADVIAPLLGQAVPNEVVEAAVEQYFIDNPASGNVVGPTDSATDELALFSGTTGRLLKRGLTVGDGASANFGTGSADVVRGDDSRVVNALQLDSNLSDLGDVAEARDNLELGGASVLDVGTGPGTVAAGDDARIVGALQEDDPDGVRDILSLNEGFVLGTGDGGRAVLSDGAGGSVHHTVYSDTNAPDFVQRKAKGTKEAPEDVTLGSIFMKWVGGAYFSGAFRLIGRIYGVVGGFSTDGTPRPSYRINAVDANKNDWPAFIMDIAGNLFLPKQGETRTSTDARLEVQGETLFSAAGHAAQATLDNSAISAGVLSVGGDGFISLNLASAADITSISSTLTGYSEITIRNGASVRANFVHSTGSLRLFGGVNVSLGFNECIVLKRIPGGAFLQVGGSAGAIGLNPVSHSGTTYTIAQVDHGNTAAMTNGAGCTVTIPADLPPGVWGYIVQMGAGQSTIVAASGGAIRVPPSRYAKTSGQYSRIMWQVIGNVGGSAAEILLSENLSTTP